MNMNKKVLSVAVSIMLLLCGCKDAGNNNRGNQNKVADTINAQIDAENEKKNEQADNEISDTVTDETITETNTEENTVSDTEQQTTAVEATTTDAMKDVKVDIDLTQMSSDMVFATVSQMMCNPDQYIGMTVKVKGIYSPFYYEETHKYYQYVVIEDALACCSQGMEFVWGDGTHAYPDDYPPEYTNIEIIGSFDTYLEEDHGIEYKYCHLTDAQMTVLQ